MKRPATEAELDTNQPELSKSDSNTKEASATGTKATTDAATSTSSTSATKKRATSKIVQISRTISACQRCRTKKTKCDSNIPCSKCQKAGVECIGLDSTGRAVPRSYLVYLEDKVNILERLLEKNGIEFDDGDALRRAQLDEEMGQNVITTGGDEIVFTGDEKKASTADSDSAPTTTGTTTTTTATNGGTNPGSAVNSGSNKDDLSTRARNLQTSAPTPSQDAHDPAFYVGDSSGISFAKLLFTAVNFQPSHHNSHLLTTRPLANNHSETANPGSNETSPQAIPAASASLASAKKVKIMTLPSQSLAEQYLKQYFEQSNPQLPILHREEFIERYFNPIYGELSPDVTLASNNTPISNFTKARNLTESSWYQRHANGNKGLELMDPTEIAESLHLPLFFLFILFAVSTSINLQSHPAETSTGYRAQALQFLDALYSSDDKLECLQGLLLLTQYSIMRPTTPGVWYNLGTMLRVCVDLGLHSEKTNTGLSPFVKDLRRRLFWCAYSLDRQICLYLGRPFGIPEEAISAWYPIDVDDRFLKRDDQEEYQRSMIMQQSYKTVSIFFFKIRKIQSEILQTLYFQNSQLPRPYQSLDHWKSTMESQIEQWHANLPTVSEINCNFNKAFFELNYHHTKMLLFGINPRSQIPNWFKIHESSVGIITTYGSLFSGKGVNYTWLTVHNLFMAGTSYLYAIYHSLEYLNVSYKGFKETCKTVGMVLKGLKGQCEAAGGCLEIFKILSAGIERLKFLQTQQQPQPQQHAQKVQQNSMINTPPTSGPTAVNQLQPQQLTQQAGFSPMFSDGSINNEDEMTRFFDNLQQQTQPLQPPQNFSQQQQPTQTYSQAIAMQMNPNPNIAAMNGFATNNNGIVPQFQETERVFELMNQVSMDSIWEHFFHEDQGHQGQQQQQQQHQNQVYHTQGQQL